MTSAIAFMPFTFRAHEFRIMAFKLLQKEFIFLAQANRLHRLDKTSGGEVSDVFSVVGRKPETGYHGIHDRIGLNGTDVDALRTGLDGPRIRSGVSDTIRITVFIGGSSMIFRSLLAQVGCSFSGNQTIRIRYSAS